MAYNKNSFLTGLAAARCLRGWGPATRADFAPEAVRALAARARVLTAGAASGESELQESGHTAPYVHFRDGSRLLVWDYDESTALNEGGTYAALMTDALAAYKRGDAANNTYTVYTTDMTGVSSRTKTDYDGNSWTFSRNGNFSIAAANGTSRSVSMSTNVQSHSATFFGWRRGTDSETGAPTVEYLLYRADFLGGGCSTTWALSTGQTTTAADLNRADNAVELLTAYGTFHDGENASGVTADAFRDAFYNETTGVFHSIDFLSAVPAGTSFPAVRLTLKAAERLSVNQSGTTSMNALSLDNSIWYEDITKPAQLAQDGGVDVNFVQGWSMGIELNRIALGRR